jgi:hypothetical protein
VLYRLSAAAVTTFTVERPQAGRKVKGNCVRPTPANRKRKACTRYVAAKGKFIHNGAEGSNHFRFTGRLAGKKLPPGRYRLAVYAVDSAGNTSAAARKDFRIIP